MSLIRDNLPLLRFDSIPWDRLSYLPVQFEPEKSEYWCIEFYMEHSPFIFFHETHLDLRWFHRRLGKPGLSQLIYEIDSAVTRCGLAQHEAYARNDRALLDQINAHRDQLMETSVIVCEFSLTIYRDIPVPILREEWLRYESFLVDQMR